MGTLICIKQGKFMRRQRQCSDFISHVYLILYSFVAGRLPGLINKVERVNFIICIKSAKLYLTEIDLCVKQSHFNLTAFRCPRIDCMWALQGCATGNWHWACIFSFPTLEQGEKFSFSLWNRASVSRIELIKMISTQHSSNNGKKLSYQKNLVAYVIVLKPVNKNLSRIKLSS